MFCGILSRCDHQSVHQLAITRFAIMCENASSAIGATTPMETHTDEEVDIEIDVDDDISVGSASPAPIACDAEESLPIVDNAKLNTEIGGKEESKPSDTTKGDVPDSSISPGASKTPPVAHQIINNGTAQRSLKFSIDNILKADFGKKVSESLSIIDQPVDLSRVNNEPIKPNNLFGSVVQQTLSEKEKSDNNDSVWPAWVYCTRYSDRPSAGPRTRRIRQRNKKDEKRPRTAFTTDQLSRLKKEFQENRYLTEKRRQDLSKDLGLNESQIKIWFQNKRAKIKKQVSGSKNPLALQLMAQGLYNHSTIPVHDEEEEKLLGLI